MGKTNELQTLVVQTVLGDFKIAAMPNEMDQKIWRVLESPATFKAMADEVGLEFKDLILNAWQGDEMGRNAIKLLRSYMPQVDIKDRERSKVKATRMNHPAQAHKKDIALKSKFSTHITLHSGARLRKRENAA